MPIRTLVVSLACLAVLLLFFVLEYFVLRGRVKRIPLRVAVAGTRGKSTVTRLVAAALRASGRRVLAKTTGSRPVLIHPDGSEHEIRRGGPPTLLEGKELLRTARRLGAEAVVAELMSINPEYLGAESCRLLQPSLLAVTNVRLDHQEVMGLSRAEIAGSLASAIPPRCTVFMLQEEVAPALAERARRVGSRLVAVPRPAGGGAFLPGTKSRPWDFPENTRLALAVSRACGVGKEAALKAMASARPDLGAFRVWRVWAGQPSRVWMCAAGFAANEPESTAVLLERLRASGLLKKGPRLALLNLRDDRPDRTRQWLAAMKDGFFREFDELFVAGASQAVARLWRKTRPKEIPRVSLIHEREPGALMERILGDRKSSGLLFGAGNIVGLGRALVEHWEKHGTSHA